MFSHFTLGTNDMQRCRCFYEAVLAPFELVHRGEDEFMMLFGTADKDYPHLFLCKPFDKLPATWSNGFHLAFNAGSTDAVDRFYQAALDNGGIDEGAPGLRPHYAKDYYGAYVRDPDGNKLQAVCYTNGRSHASNKTVISHITLGLADLKREQRFYDAVMATIGLKNLPDEGDEESVGYGYPDTDLPVVYVQPPFDGRAATWGNGTHVAFHADNHQMVKDFYEAAVSHGGRSDGEPGYREDYSHPYYACYVRDAVGNKLQAVCRKEA